MPLAALLLALPLQAPIERDDVAAYAEDAAAIVEEALARGSAYEMLAALCAAAPRRLSGSPAYAAAVDWAQREMESIGLENVRLEPVTVPPWVRGSPERLVALAPAEIAGSELRVLALGGSVATPEDGVAAPIVVADGLDALDELGERVRGRIVLLNGPMPPGHPDTFAAYGAAVGQRVRGAARAARHGAVAVLVRSMTTSLDDVPHTGAMRYEDGVPRIPAAAVSTLSADRIARLVERGEEVVLRLQLACETLPDVESANVVGELVGRERPEEIVLVGGHLDSWDVGQGAHDDGAGCVQALEVPRVLLALGLRPRRTIRVVLFANEENGLRGAHAYRDAHRDELPRHVLALESDRGGFTPRGFTVDAAAEAAEVVQRIASLLADAGADRVVPGSGGADVSPLAAEGVPAVGFLPDPQRYFALHHSELDVIEAVDRRELQLGAGAIAALCYVVADLPAPLPRKPIGGEGSR